jgi:histone acetyltransferase (RNA polymerase elongator complex component)
MLDYFNKKLKLEDIEKAISLTKKLGIWTTGCIMINQYTTNHTVIKQTSDFLLKTKPDFLRISPLIVIPGTKLHSLLQTQGCFRNSDYLSCLEGRFIESRYINDKELYRIKRNLYLSYYLKSGSIISWVRNLLRLK